jgi:hypothetical protein
MWRFLDAQGGHWCQYGPSYKFLKGLRGQVQLLTQDKYCPNLQLTIPEKGKFDEDAVRFILSGNRLCKNNIGMPLININIFWDEENMRYVYSISTFDTLSK